VSTPEIRKILEDMGRAALAWSSIETLWYLAFATLLPQLPQETRKAIFFYLHTFASRRQLTIEVASSLLPQKSPERTKMGQLNARTDDLASTRNSIIHGEFGFTYNSERDAASILFSRGDDPKKPNKLAGKDLALELSRFCADAAGLADEIEEFIEGPLSSRIPAAQRFLANRSKLRVRRLLQETPESVAQLQAILAFLRRT